MVMLVMGRYSDRRGERLLTAFALMIALTSAYLMLGVSTSPMIVGVAYLLFASTCFTISMLLASSWADLIHPRELAVGAAAINTLGNIGAFVMPYGWGVARDATGNFQVGLMALTAATVLAGALTLWLRRSVLKTQPLVVAAA